MEGEFFGIAPTPAFFTWQMATLSPLARLALKSRNAKGNIIKTTLAFDSVFRLEIRDK